MTNFLKTCCKGILCIIAFPFAIALVSIYAVVGLLIFVFLIIKSILLFFKGQTIFSDLPEDIEAKKILAEREARMSPSIPNNQQAEPQQNSNDNGPLSLYPSDSNMYKSEFSGMANRQNEQPISAPVEEVKTEPVSRNETPLQKRDDDEIIGTYKPLNSNNKDK